WEDSIDGETPDLSVGKSGRAVRDIIGKRPRLEPQFRVAVTRTAVAIRAKNGTSVEAAHDKAPIEVLSGFGHVKPADRRRPIHELELELKEGDDTTALFDIALAVAKTVPLEIESRSKAERGYALLSGDDSLKPVYSPKIPLKKAMTLGMALKTAGRAYIE